MTDLPVEEQAAMESARRIVTDNSPPRAAFTWGWFGAREYSKQREEKLEQRIRELEGVCEIPLRRRNGSVAAGTERHTVWLRCEVEADTRYDAEQVVLDALEDCPAEIYVEDRDPDGLGDRRPGA